MYQLSYVINVPEPTVVVPENSFDAPEVTDYLNVSMMLSRKCFKFASDDTRGSHQTAPSAYDEIVFEDENPLEDPDNKR